MVKAPGLGLPITRPHPSERLRLLGDLELQLAARWIVRHAYAVREVSRGRPESHALGVTGGILIAAGLQTQRGAKPYRFRRLNRPPCAKPRMPLRLRYANGEIRRENYLQGKVELED
jgi:hypothetical protein